MTRLLALLIVLTASACTPAMQDAWRPMSPAEREFGLSFLATDTGFRVHQTGEQFSATIVGELVFGNRT